MDIFGGGAFHTQQRSEPTFIRPIRKPNWHCQAYRTVMARVITNTYKTIRTKPLQLIELQTTQMFSVHNDSRTKGSNRE